MSRDYHDYYVYILAYPQSMGGAVFYVGKGRYIRIDDHFREARRGVISPKCDIIRSIEAAGEQVVREKMYTDLSEDEALRLEKEAIDHYSPEALTNSHMKNTYKAYTPEWRNKRSQATKEKWEQLKKNTWWQRKHPYSKWLHVKAFRDQFSDSPETRKKSAAPLQIPRSLASRLYTSGQMSFSRTDCAFCCACSCLACSAHSRQSGKRCQWSRAGSDSAVPLVASLMHPPLLQGRAGEKVSVTCACCRVRFSFSVMESCPFLC